jgi:hypothetical protein
MKKLFLILMLVVGTVSASVEDAPEITIEDEISLGLLMGGTIVFAGSLATAFLIEVPEVTMPLIVGGMALGLTAAVSGVILEAVSSDVHNQINDFEEATTRIR